MPSTLGNSILDTLIPVLDQVRGIVNPLVGNRQWTVTVVRRTWNGRKGDLIAGFTLSETVLSPQPLVEFQGDDKGVGYEMKGAGREEEGICRISEVSLAYSEDQLAPVSLAGNVEFYYRLTDAYGQNVQPRHYVPAGPPAPDRIKSIGWVITLVRRHVVES